MVIPFGVADWKLWAVTLVEGIWSTTLRANLLSSTTETGNHLLLAGSASTTPLPLWTAALGYEWSELYPSWSQRNNIELSAILILSPVDKPWNADVIVMIPETGSYSALVIVNVLEARNVWFPIFNTNFPVDPV